MLPRAPTNHVGGSFDVVGEAPYRPAMRIALLPHEGKLPEGRFARSTVSLGSIPARQVMAVRGCLAPCTAPDVAKRPGDRRDCRGAGATPYHHGSRHARGDTRARPVVALHGSPLRPAAASIRRATTRRGPFARQTHTYHVCHLWYNRHVEVLPGIGWCWWDPNTSPCTRRILTATMLSCQRSNEASWTYRSDSARILQDDRGERFPIPRDLLCGQGERLVLLQRARWRTHKEVNRGTKRDLRRLSAMT